MGKLISLDRHRKEKEFGLPLEERKNDASRVIEDMKRLFFCDDIEFTCTKQVPEGKVYILIGRETAKKYNGYIGYYNDEK